MLAVRDEVDELKERIVELKDENWKTKKENEILKSLLTSEQAAQAQQLLSKQQVRVVLNHAVTTCALCHRPAKLSPCTSTRALIFTANSRCG